MTTAIIHHPIFKEHDTGPGHPETPSRYNVVMEALRDDEELWSKLREVRATEAARGDIQAAHSPQLYKLVERVVSEGTGYLDADTVVSMRSLDAAKHAAGAPCQAIDLIMSGEVKNAFVPVRPPGHHATASRDNPPWLRWFLAWVRAHGRRFYDFDGLAAFKKKFRPHAWEPIYAVADEPQFSIRTLYAIAAAFSGRSLASLSIRGMTRAAVQEWNWFVRQSDE